MSLLTIFLSIISDWRGLFCKRSVFLSATFHAFATFSLRRRKTLTSFIEWLNEQKRDWSKHYKLYSRSFKNSQDLFYPIIKRSLPFFEKPYVNLIADYTGIKKTGKKVANSGWQRDPMSPKWRSNLRWGLTFLQMAICLPLYEKENLPCRSLPIRWVNLKRKAKPSKRASELEIKEYKQFCKENNRSKIFVEELKQVREVIDKAGGQNKALVVSLDGEFCNKTVLSSSLERVHFILRARKNIRLCCKDNTSTRRIYSKEKFTPEQIRQDTDIPWMKTQIYFGGQQRTVYYKAVENILWQGGAKRQLLDLLVLRPIPYRRNQKGRLLYRQPAYLLCTRQPLSIKERIQAYFDRWQIEVNHKDEKDTLGIGQAQLRNEKSIQNQSTLMVAAYSALLLSAILANTEIIIDKDKLLPTWYKKIKRLSTKHLAEILVDELRNPKSDCFKQAA